MNGGGDFMNIKASIEDMMQVKKIQVNAIQAIGFRGDGPQDEQKLFSNLKERKRYLSSFPI